jgi:hypothetical protein
MPTYESTLSLVSAIDGKFSSLASMCEKERKDKSQLLSDIEKKKNYIASIKSAIASLSSGAPITVPDETTQKYISQWWNRALSVNSVSAYISEASNLASIYKATGSGSERLKKEQADAEVQINRVKKHPYYKTWVKNADKLKFDLIGGVMPDNLSGYSSEAMNLIIAYSAKVLWEPYKRYMYYHLYTVYKKEIHLLNERKKLIAQFDNVNAEAIVIIPKWLHTLESELRSQEQKLTSMQRALEDFEKDSQSRINEYSAQLESEIIRQHTPGAINHWIQQMEDANTSWDSVRSKEDIVIDEKESFILTYYNGVAKTNLSGNTYISDLAKRFVSHYHKLLHIQGNSLEFRFPLEMHLDTLRHKMVISIEAVQESTRSSVNGLVQRMVASVASNMPVGKVKFVFGDPSNTGVFSNFRDVGKNESEGSRLSTYIVDVDGIRRELERLSNEIAYTINNILKGTKTTLYQHNKERAFNSSPYVFLFLMDYPQNMTAQSLQALKNIVENGPKCGIFTVIFNVAGTSMQLLRPEEKRLAEEIAQSTFVLKSGRVYDSKGSWLDIEKEISTTGFDTFVKYYNEAIKDSQQLTVYLDELEGKVCENGDYKIPIGKNLGGETEYMSFFGSCQDYLMSGATRIGKTNALHVIIYNTIKYVPNAELYLVDFKQGVEFAPYAGLNHPVIKALAVESVPEFGYAVLRHIEDKIKAISELFINNEVKNWKEYYERTGKVIPVTIVILDEFQHLFDTEVGKDCSRIIEIIAKEGGAFNVHIILSTQSMSSVAGLTETAKINIFGRMAFYHSEKEYASMLWGDTHLALTLNGEVKGQMVFAMGDKNSQRLLQWALAKPVGTVVNELSKPINDGRYQTKLLLSTIRENPFSVFNAIINGQYTLEDAESCEITIGNEVDVFSGELRKQLESGMPTKEKSFVEKSYLKLAPRANENIMLVGNNEEIAESIFQLSIYCTLAKQIMMGRKHSIIVLAPELATKLTDICDEFKGYIEYYSQEDDLSQINLEGKEFMFVFGLQNFRSMSYQPDTQIIAARNDAMRPRMPGGIMTAQRDNSVPMTDGQILQTAVESDDIHVIAWHNNMQNLAAMFGGNAKIQDFLYKFLHKIALRMTDKNDSRMFINSEVCTDLSAKAAIYVKMNKERIIRPYKAMDSSYCKELNGALRRLDGGNNQ